MIKTLRSSLVMVPALVLCSYTANAQTLDAGNSHTLYLCSDSIVRSWGFNTSGQLGLGTTATIAFPTAIPGLTQVKAVAAGGPFSLFLKADGTVWGCGLNNSGQLGLGAASNVNSTPVQIPGLNNVVGISAGSGHSLFLKSDGTVWACGLNGSGQLGNGTTSDELSPIQIPGLANVSAVIAGGNHSLFLMNDGTVKACGLNLEGQLGQGASSFGIYTPTSIASLSGIAKIDAGWSFSLFLKNDGTVWSCGGNDYGQLGIGSTTDQPTPVQITALSNIMHISSSGNSDRALFVKNDGTAWVCGHNGAGQLGLGTTTPELTAVQNTFITNVANVASGTYHSIFIKNDGTGMASGGNAYGQHGAGNFANSTSLVSMFDLCPLPNGIEEEIAGENFGMYPNPAGQTVTIESADVLTSVNIYSSTGKLVQTETSNKFSVAALPAGIYLVKIITANGTGTSRLVKQ